MANSRDFAVGERFKWHERIDKDLDPYAQMEVFNELLDDFRKRTAFRNHDENLVYLHPRILSYLNARSKKYWLSDGLDGPEDRDIFDCWWRAITDAHTRIGVFATWPECQVGCGIPWAEQEWHCWAAVLVNNPSTQENPRGYGKHLYIWDCLGNMDFDPITTRPRGPLLGAQQTLVKKVSQRYRLDSLWYFGGKDQLRQCLRHTAKWAISIAEAQDSPFRKADPRFSAFKRIPILR
ncbi:MAG: hypothetical protein LQ337_002595 [Flavoplaca oasis]|nr:MAG: hypothetical protein LQ337_002595 [Flavoplaca oasis]